LPEALAAQQRWICENIMGTFEEVANAPEGTCTPWGQFCGLPTDLAK
jgi:hypothetical protein